MKKTLYIKKRLFQKSLLSILLFFFTLSFSTASLLAKDDCRKRYPNPRIKFKSIDAEGRIHIPVVNWNAYDNQMFRAAPDLPPCGANADSARTWVDIFDAATHARIYGFCALGSANDLIGIWFKPNAPIRRVYIILDDRACKKRYQSNTIVIPNAN